MKNSNIKERAKLKNIEKYGVDNPMKVSLIKNKMKETKIKNGNQVPDELLDSYLLYRRNVDNNTDTKELFNNWDGYDYYDGEYIKNNNIKDLKNYPSFAGFAMHYYKSYRELCEKK